MLNLLQRYGFGPTLAGLTLTAVVLSVLITAAVNLLTEGRTGRNSLLVAAFVGGCVSLLFGGVQLQLLMRLGQARDEMHRLSITDELTRAYNRRHFMRIAENGFDRARKGGSPFSLVLFDIDDFKRINDTYGHLAGDGVLRQLADVTRSSIRKHDLLARWGGEEFMLLLPEAGLEEALEVARRVQAGIEQNPTYLAGEPLKITVSMGVALFKPQMPAFDDLLSQADDALYRAKNLGKNRIETVPLG